MIEEEGLDLRESFVVNPEGEIKAYEVYDNGIGRNAGELIRKVQAAQFVAEMYVVELKLFKVDLLRKCAYTRVETQIKIK